MTARLIRGLVLVSLIACLPGCMKLKVIGSRNVDQTTEREHVMETYHGSFWGIPWDEPELKINKDHHLIRIYYHDNVLYLLASVVTLGVWVPQEVEWWSDEASDEEGGPSLKPNKNKD